MSALLEVNGLRKAFGGHVAVDGLTFVLWPGEIVGLLGPNGSGKTTAINMISGSLLPDKGSIRIHGQEICGKKPHRIAAMGIARTFQLVRVASGMTAVDNVVAALAFVGPRLTGTAAEVRAVALLSQLGLGERLHTIAGDLTYIDQKRLELARALALDPQVLLLDEWLAGLNPAELLEGIALIQSLRTSGIAVLMVEHVMDAVRALCDRCVVMAAGKLIADGHTDAVLSRPDVRRAYLGEDDEEKVDA